MHGASRQLGIEAGRDRIAKISAAAPSRAAGPSVTATASTVSAASSLVMRKHLQQDEVSFTPFKKQMQQQEEGGAPLDEDEQKAFAERRRVRRGPHTR